MAYYNRRDMIRRLGALGLASGGGLGSALASMPVMAADTSGYKALVCIFLRGGMDGWDTLIPYDAPSRASYETLRGDLLQSYRAAGISRDASDLIELTPSNAFMFGGRSFGFPRELEPLASLFQSGMAAIVSNVGPLIEPTDRDRFMSGAARLPARLFSHNDQQSTWESSAPEGSQVGWGGLFGDFVRTGNTNPTFTTISTAGNSVFLNGPVNTPYTLSDSQIPIIRALNNGGRIGVRTDRARELLDEHFRGIGNRRNNIYERDFRTTSQSAIQAADQFRAVAGPQGVTLQTQFPPSRLGIQLSTIAEVISIRNGLGTQRQVFFCDTGGFDTHSGQTTTLPGLQSDIAGSISAFFDAMAEIGITNEVTLFTASDFGRTLTANGDGTDHGWGGEQFVVGGAVNGGAIYGTPALAELETNEDSGRGRLIPTTSVEQYGASLGAWFGLSPSELNSVFPQLSEFSTTNLGFV